VTASAGCTKVHVGRRAPALAENLGRHEARKIYPGMTVNVLGLARSARAWLGWQPGRHGKWPGRPAVHRHGLPGRSQQGL
jgi:hypothetical protein